MCVPENIAVERFERFSNFFHHNDLSRLEIVFRDVYYTIFVNIFKVHD